MAQEHARKGRRISRVVAREVRGKVTWTRLCFLLVLALVALTAGSVSKPHDFAPGSTISSSQVNADFDTLYALVNGNVDSANLASDAGSLAKVSAGSITAYGGNIGIGTVTPSTKLEVSGTVRMSGLSMTTGATTGYVLTSDSNGTGTWQSPPASPWAEGNGNVYRVSGRVGIGTSTPRGPLEIVTTEEPQIRVTSGTASAGVVLDGNESFIGLYSSFYGQATWLASDFSFFKGSVAIGTNTLPSQKLYVSGDVYATESITQGSSRAYKKQIRELDTEDALSALENLKPVRFHYKDQDDEENLGFIAEDVPDLLATKDRKGTTDMDYIAVLVKVVQEQQKKIEELESLLKTTSVANPDSGRILGE